MYSVPQNDSHFSSTIRNEDPISIENDKKESFLNQQIEQIERRLKNMEEEIIKDFPFLQDSKLSTLLHKKYYNELEIIDDLFIKADHYDSKSANLIMDEINERINSLRLRLKKSTLVKNQLTQ